MSDFHEFVSIYQAKCETLRAQAESEIQKTIREHIRHTNPKDMSYRKFTGNLLQGLYYITLARFIEPQKHELIKRVMAERYRQRREETHA